MTTQGVASFSRSPANNGTADPNVNMAEGMAPSAVNDNVRALMSEIAGWRDDLFGVNTNLLTAGTSTAYTASTNQTYLDSTALAGAIFSIIPHTNCNNNPTLNVDGIGAKGLVFSDGVTSLTVGALVQSVGTLVQYVKVLDKFVVKNPAKIPVTGLDINGATSTQVGSSDALNVYHVASTANYKVTVSALLAGLNTLDSKATPDGAQDYTLIYDSTGGAAKKALLSTLPPATPRGYISGCTIANGTDSTNDINVSSGICRDATNTVDIVVPTLAGKQLDANWTAGASAGMRDSGAGIANTSYGIWAVRTSASSTGDIYATTHSTAATVITAIQAESGGGSYAYARRIASIIRRSATIIPFTQDHDFFYTASTIDFTTTAGQTMTLTTITVPTNIVVKPLMTGVQVQTPAGDATTALAPAVDSTKFMSVMRTTVNSQAAAFHCIGPPTNTSAQINIAATVGGNATQALGACGWVDARGKDE